MLRISKNILKFETDAQKLGETASKNMDAKIEKLTKVSTEAKTGSAKKAAAAQLKTLKAAKEKFVAEAKIGYKDYMVLKEEQEVITADAKKNINGATKLQKEL